MHSRPCKLCIHPLQLPSSQRVTSLAIKMSSGIAATNEERRNYLGRLIAEEQQKQKDAGDSEYQD